MQTKLVTTAALRKEFNLTQKAFEEIAAKVGLASLDVNVDGCPAKMFEEVEARRLISNEISRRDNAAKEATKEKVVSVDFASRDLLKTVESNIIATCDAIEEKVDTALVGLERINGQHAVLLKAIEALRGEVSTWRGALTAPAAIVPVVVPSASTPLLKDEHVKTLGLERILIFGLPTGMRREIEREFSDCFDLRLRDSEDTRKSNLQAEIDGANHIFVMGRFCNHGIENVKRMSGKKLTIIGGGVSTLRDALTERFAAKAA